MDTTGTHHFAFRLRRTLAVVASLGIVVLTSVGSAEARPSRDSRSAACVISEFAPVFTFSGVIQGKAVMSGCAGVSGNVCILNTNTGSRLACSAWSGNGTKFSSALVCGGSTYKTTVNANGGPYVPSTNSTTC